MVRDHCTPLILISIIMEAKDIIQQTKQQDIHSWTETADGTRLHRYFPVYITFKEGDNYYKYSIHRSERARVSHMIVCDRYWSDRDIYICSGSLQRYSLYESEAKFEEAIKRVVARANKGIPVEELD